MKHQPDHEFDVMRKTLSSLQKLSPAGRRRVIGYLAQRIDEMPEQVELHGEQQLDLEEAPSERQARGNGTHVAVA